MDKIYTVSSLCDSLQVGSPESNRRIHRRIRELLARGILVSVRAGDTATAPFCIGEKERRICAVLLAASEMGMKAASLANLAITIRDLETIPSTLYVSANWEKEFALHDEPPECDVFFTFRPDNYLKGPKT